MLLIYFLLSIKIVISFDCNENEVYFEKSCYNLIKLDSFEENNTSCNKSIINNNNDECIDYLNKLINRLIQIYTDNLKFNDLYQFSYLDVKTSRSKLLINKLLLQNNNQVENIFLNYYVYNNNHYIENQPSDDEHPNVMMHGAIQSGDVKCISGERIQNLNESFRFYYQDCSKELPFICVKPYSGQFDREDKCSHFDKYQPGGRWFECDKLTDDFNVSKSHKCCMYNVKWSENFQDANNLCNKFDSFVFSLRLKGYKLILENYANFLSTNYFDSNHFEDLFSFWTSCKSKSSIENSIEKHECIEKNPIAEQISSSSVDFKETQGLKINVLNVNLGKFNYTKSFYNLTFVSLLLNSLKIGDDQYLKFCSKWFYSSSIDNLADCLFKIWNVLDAKTYFLASRKARSFEIETKTYRLNSILNETKCFHYSNESNKFHLSIPIINVCYHLTIIDLASNVSSNLMNYSVEPNFDSALNYSLSQELLSIILNRLGIANFNDECTLNDSSLLNNNNSILISYKSCLNLLSLIKITNKNDDDLLKVLKTKKAIILHSYSFIQKVFHLNCHNSLLHLNEAIHKCNHHQYCLFTCPINCEQDKFIWRFASNPYVYLNSTSICLAAHHSNLIRSNNSEHKFYLNINNKNNHFGLKLLKIKNNNFYSNLWPPLYYTNNNNWNETSSLNGFYFEQTFDSLIHESNQFHEFPLVLIKAVYNNLNEVFEPILYISKSNKIDFKYKKILNGSSLKSFHASNDYYDLNFEQISIKFPINIRIDNYSSTDHQTIRLDSSSSVIIKNIKNSNKCHWFFNTKDSGINCGLDLNLKFNYKSINDDIHNELNIIYSNHTLFKSFTRVILLSDKLLMNNSCQNGGLPSITANTDQCLCFPGFNGTKCEQRCKQNYFGNECQFTCPLNDVSCKGLLICNLDPIGCSCASGFKGYECNESCDDDDSWGPNCMFSCSKNNCTKCDRFTGECSCPINKEGIECNKCVDGFYGQDCTQKCDQFENGNCSNYICLPVNKCSIETDQYSLKEYEFNDLTLVCVLIKQAESNNECKQDFNDFCRLNLYEGISKIIECSNFSDISQICKHFNSLNENWSGYLLSTEFSCNECKKIENNCNLDLKKETILMNKNFNFKLIIMWLATFGSILLVILASKLCIMNDFKRSDDLNDDDFSPDPPTCIND